MNPDTTTDCCAPNARRSGSASGALALGVAGVALCCALPSLLAGGILTDAAGWGFGIWATIGVVVFAVIALLFRRSHQRQSPSTIDAMSTQQVGATSQRSAPVKVVE